MERRQGTEAVSYSLLQMIIHYMELDKKTHCFGTDTPIYHSEIHLISTIAQNPDIHVKGLAQHMGITSASVSEMIGKLKRKGLVEKSTDSENLSRLKLSLTSKGLLAHEEHMRYHYELNCMIAEELQDASAQQIAFLRNFCDDVCNRLDGFQF